MKHKIIFSAFAFVVALVGFASSTDAQTLGVSKVTSDNTEILTGSFSAPPDRNYVVYEARPRAGSAAECFAATDFSTAVPVGPDRAAVSYDPGSLVWYLRNSNAVGSPGGCSVLLVRTSAGTTDYTMFRARFGSTSAFVDADLRSKEESDSARAQRSMVTSVQVTFNSPGSF